MSSSFRALCAALALISTFVQAADWSVSGGLSLRDSRSTQPNGGYQDHGWSASATANKQVDDWNLGGGLSYTLSTLDVNGNAGQFRPASTSVVAMASRDVGNDYSVSGSLGYGDSAVNASQVAAGNTVSYRAKSDFLASSLGLTKSLSLSRRSLATLSARYTHVSTRRDAYTNSAGTATAGADSGFGFLTFGAGLSYRTGRFTPYVQVDWNTSNKEFVAGTGDKDYFSINTGLSYRLDARTYLSASFSTVAGKAYTRDNALGVSVRYAF